MQYKTNNPLPPRTAGLSLNTVFNIVKCIHRHCLKNKTGGTCWRGHCRKGRLMTTIAELVYLTHLIVKCLLEIPCVYELSCGLLCPVRCPVIYCVLWVILCFIVLGFRWSHTFIRCIPRIQRCLMFHPMHQYKVLSHIFIVAHLAVCLVHLSHLTGTICWRNCSLMQICSFPGAPFLQVWTNCYSFAT